MAATTVSSREFNQDTSRAKRLLHGPVFITDRGRPAHVPLNIEEHRRLAGQPRNILHALSMPGRVDIEFDPQKLDLSVRAADFS